MRLASVITDQLERRTVWWYENAQSSIFGRQPVAQYFLFLKIEEVDVLVRIRQCVRECMSIDNQRNVLFTRDQLPTTLSFVQSYVARSSHAIHIRNPRCGPILGPGTSQLST